MLAVETILASLVTSAEQTAVNAQWSTLGDALHMTGRGAQRKQQHALRAIFPKGGA